MTDLVALNGVAENTAAVTAEAPTETATAPIAFPRVVDFTEEDLPSPVPGSVVRLRGLPFSATEADVRVFAEGYCIADPDGVLILTHGDRRGEGYVRLKTADEADRFLRERNRRNVGERYVEIYPAHVDDMETARKGEESSGSLTKNPIVRLRGLPFQATEEDIRTFFIQIQADIVNVKFVEDSDGRRTGDAFLEVLNDDAVRSALTKHRLLMGTRYIEVSVSTALDREAVLHVASRRGRSHARHMQQAAAVAASGGFPLFPMMPFPGFNGKVGAGSTPNAPVSVQIGKEAANAAAAAQAAQAAAAFMMRAAMFGMMPPGMMPPGMFTSSSITPPTGLVPPSSSAIAGSAPRAQSRFIIRVRGLPFSATEATVAEFFHDVNIPPQGVHMVYNAQERPTGEAFVEVEAEEDITTALDHNGGALGHRYIEVFRSSAADMQRLSGAPVDSSPAPMFPPGMMGYPPMMMPPYGMYNPYFSYY